MYDTAHHNMERMVESRGTLRYRRRRGRGLRHEIVIAEGEDDTKWDKADMAQVHNGTTALCQMEVMPRR